MPLGRILAGLAMLVWAAPVSAEPLPYRGPHPVDFDGAWHELTSVHVHDDLPVGDAGFARIDGVMIFLADPVAYGYTGSVFAFAGLHPLPASIGGYCGITGEHRHPFPPEGEFRRSADGVYRFVGALRGGVATYRPGQVDLPEPVRREREAREAQPVPVYPYGYPYAGYAPWGGVWWAPPNRGRLPRHHFRGAPPCVPPPGAPPGACGPAWATPSRHPPAPPPDASRPPRPPARPPPRRVTPARGVVQPTPVEPPI